MTASSSKASLGLSPGVSPVNSNLDLSTHCKQGDELFLQTGGGVSEQEALIKVELDIIKSSSGVTDSENLKIANVQFNNLDFVGESALKVVDSLSRYFNCFSRFSLLLFL